MKRALFLIVALLPVAAAALAAPPQAGDLLPVVELAAPGDAAQRQYLGVGAGERFRIADIQSEVVIVQIFSMYCPHCQRQAPEVNRLFEIIEADRHLRGRVKLIGIGVGNSEFEVGVFRQSFTIPFPLFADERLAVHQQLGSVRTPYFFGARIGGDGAARVFYSRAGGTEDGGAGEFLEILLENAGLGE